MDSGQLLTRERVIFELKASDGQTVLNELIKPLLADLPEGSEPNLLRLLSDREELSSTGIGSGVALPHVKLAGLDSQLMVLARSKTGIPFGAIDKLPVHLFILLVAPHKEATLHLKTLAKISKILHRDEARQRLLTATDADRLYQEFIDHYEG